MKVLLIVTAVVVVLTVVIGASKEDKPDGGSSADAGLTAKRVADQLNLRPFCRALDRSTDTDASFRLWRVYYSDAAQQVGAEPGEMPPAREVFDELASRC